MSPENGTYLLSDLREIALRRQSIGRADWEKLPWAPDAYSSPDAVEIGRMLAYSEEGRKDSGIMRKLFRRLVVDIRTDWMRGQEEPQGWEDRIDIARENWHESCLAVRA